MIKALLLDLDDTLLINDMDTFAPHYYRALLAKVAGLCPPARFLDALDKSTRAMMRNDGTNGTNEQVFAAEFFPRLPCSRDELMPVLDAFYRHEFNALRVHTAVDPLARPLVALCAEKGFQMAIATQPLFPLVAIEARLRWAEVETETFRYDWISSYETMSACKPHPCFFERVLERLGRAPGECLMVGDSPGADMAAGRLGIRTFWVDRQRGTEQERVRCDAQGDLADLIHLIETGGIHGL
jgi:putative hydrolase of the HAD superfamily